MKTYSTFNSKQKQYHLSKRLTFVEKLLIILITIIILLIDVKMAFPQVLNNSNLQIQINYFYFSFQSFWQIELKNPNEMIGWISNQKDFVDLILQCLL